MDGTSRAHLQVDLMQDGQPQLVHEKSRGQHLDLRRIGICASNGRMEDKMASSWLALAPYSAQNRPGCARSSWKAAFCKEDAARQGSRRLE